MANIWIKRCPRCRNYMRKTEPQEAAVCCSCGWEEYVVVTFFCAVANKYCPFLCQEDGSDEVLTHPSQAKHLLPR